MALERPLPRGIYAPVPCPFFHDTEDVDYETYKSLITRIGSCGVTPTVSGTMGEAPHLSHSERQKLIIAAREALDGAHLQHVPIIAGVGAMSTRESIEFAKEAHEAGADFAIAISPGYYAGALLADPTSLKHYFSEIAAASPIPVMMYNFPGVTAGIDLDSDFIIDIAKTCPNICGVKLTCGNVGKLTRVTAVVESEEFKRDYPRKNSNAPFYVIDGFIDFLLPSMASGSSGAITGIANFAPRTCMELWRLCQSMPSSEEYQKAQKLQNLVAAADGVAIKIGIPGMKMILNRLHSFGKNPRRPIMPMSEEKADQVMRHPDLRAILDYEKSLE